MQPRFEKVSPDPGRSFRCEERRLAQFDAPWHFHPEFELTLIVASRGRRFVGDSIERFAEGDLVLLGPNIPHFWNNEGRQRRKSLAHSVVVQFLPDFPGGEFWTRPECIAVRRLLSRGGRGLQFTGPAAREAARRLISLAAMKGLPALLELFGVLNLLAEARTARPLTSLGYAPSLDRRTEQRLARVYAFLTTRFQEPLTLAQIASVAAMTPPGFSRYFRRVTGRNVSAFINELRIDHAARLLAETTRTVADIAGEAGYSTLSNFNRRFRERLRCSPREYRRSLA